MNLSIKKSIYLLKNNTLYKNCGIILQMEAYSVEDNGESICFNVYIYNVQPGVEIDYSTGVSKLAE